MRLRCPPDVTHAKTNPAQQPKSTTENTVTQRGGNLCSGLANWLCGMQATANRPAAELLAKPALALLRSRRMQQKPGGPPCCYVQLAGWMYIWMVSDSHLLWA